MKKISDTTLILIEDQDLQPFLELRLIELGHLMLMGVIYLPSLSLLTFLQ